MFAMNYLYILVLVFLVFSVVAVGVAFVPHQGVVALIGVSFCCCVLMVMLGRTFAALVMYVVYLGGLIVVFGYCVSVEKDKWGVFEVGGLKYFVVFLCAGVVVCLWWVLLGGVDGLLVNIGLEDLFCLEVNGGCVLYSSGGAGLIVCSWGLLVVLFSILVILGWSRLGGVRPF